MSREPSRQEELKSVVDLARSALHQAQYEATDKFIESNRARHRDVVAKAAEDLAKAEKAHSTAVDRIARCERALKRAEEDLASHGARHDINRLESALAEVARIAKSMGKTPEEVLNDLLK